MKTIVYCFIILLCVTLNLTHAQDELPSIYSIIDKPLTAVDTIPDFVKSNNKIRLSGTLYDADGITPISDALVALSHADAEGQFHLKKQNENSYVEHTGFVKTDADGRYTFYTFIPGSDRRFNQLKELFLLVKIGDEPAKELPTLVFEDDPLLTKRCKRRMAKKDELYRILKPTISDQMFLAEHNIVLSK